MKKRIVGILLVILIAISSVFTQPVYANPALAVEGVDLLYDLMASMGVIASMDGTDAQKRNTISDAIQKSSELQMLVQQGLDNGTLTDIDGNGVYEYHFAKSPGYSWFYDFYNTISDMFEDSSSFVVPSYSSSVSYPITNDVYEILGYGDVAPLVCYYNGSLRYVTGFLKDGTFIHYSVSSDGTVTSLPYNTFNYGIGSYIRFKSTSSTLHLFNFSFGVYSADGVLLDGGSLHCDSDSGVIMGTAGNYSCYGYFDVTDLSLGLDISASDLIPADTWSRGMDDSITNGQDVILKVGEDLTGYDNLTDVYDTHDGLVIGADIPGYVDSKYGYDKTTDTDLTADWEGVTTGIEGTNSRLDKLYNWLKALPALIGTSVIGNGTLDLSGFSDVDLSGVFPFCIPFDLIHSFQSFNVSPIEPKWTVDFSGTAYEVGGNLELDFTTFDSLFVIGRYCIYGAFVFGLIVATRKLIKG